MLFDSISYTERRNKGNYEHEELTLTAAIEDGEDVLNALEALKLLTYRALHSDPQVKDLEIKKALSEAPMVNKSPKVAETVTHKVKLAEEPKAEAKFVKGKEEAAPTYPKADGTTSEVAGDVPPPIPKEAKTPKNTKASKPKVEEEEMEEVESPFKKSEEPKAGSKSEGIVAGEKKVKETKKTPHITYDCTVKEHRSTMASYLNLNHKGWQTAKTPEELKEISTSLHGSDFMDTKGNILDGFKSQLAELFN